MLLKKQKKLALCGILCALSVVVMLLSYVPYMTYSIPVISSLFIFVAVIEIDKKYALATFFCASLLIFFLCEKESAVVYILFFGFYPILKAILEKIPNIVLEYIAKLVIFNVAVVVAYIILRFVFGISEEAEKGALGIALKIGFVVLANIAFVVYDFACTKLVELYMNRLHPFIERTFLK